MASFPDSVNKNDLGQAKVVGELLAPIAPFDQKSGRETWTLAFAPNGSYFAWSQGHRIVRLIPWTKCLNSFSGGPGAEATDGSSPRQPSSPSSDESQAVIVAGEPQERTIDCGGTVWGLAFGSSVPEKQSRCVNIEWHRFKFGQDQLLLATGLNNGRIKIWDVYTGKLLLNLMDHTDVVRDLTFAPDGSLMLVSASRDKTLRVWDLKDDGNMVKVLRGHQNWVYCSAFSPDSTILCSVGAGKAVFLWNMDNYSVLRRLEGHHNDVVSCEFSPDGALLATASYDTRVIVWDPHKGTVLLELGHLFPPPSPIFAGGANDRWVRSVSFSSDGLHIASIADDRLVRFWSIEERAPQAIAPLSAGLCCTFSPEGRVLAAGSGDGSVQFWECPRSVASLQHLCRMAVRRVSSSQQVEALAIPTPLRDYLTYRVV
ncbi:WD repeat and SOCS box-containing protein 1 [Cololabis saira]|uniref:WD repeat and SOCS box-containing protein 1 n=1 Tax=Cololabis saira TaxID=129043 RepID=UPI002AD28F6B|nr:WD repeat and SOCS box-containing protein 1 [Cololabis saira]